MLLNANQQDTLRTHNCRETTGDRARNNGTVAIVDNTFTSPTIGYTIHSDGSVRRVVGSDHSRLDVKRFGDMATLAAHRDLQFEVMMHYVRQYRVTQRSEALDRAGEMSASAIRRALRSDRDAVNQQAHRLEQRIVERTRGVDETPVRTTRDIGRPTACPNCNMRCYEWANNNRSCAVNAGCAMMDIPTNTLVYRTSDGKYVTSHVAGSSLVGRTTAACAFGAVPAISPNCSRGDHPVHIGACPVVVPPIAPNGRPLTVTAAEIAKAQAERKVALAAEAKRKAAEEESNPGRFGLLEIDPDQPVTPTPPQPDWQKKLDKIAKAEPKTEAKQEVRPAITSRVPVRPKRSEDAIPVIDATVYENDEALFWKTISKDGAFGIFGGIVGGTENN